MLTIRSLINSSVSFNLFICLVLTCLIGIQNQEAQAQGARGLSFRFTGSWGIFWTTKKVHFDPVTGLTTVDGAVVTEPEEDEDGKAVKDENGKPKMKPVRVPSALIPPVCMPLKIDKSLGDVKNEEEGKKLVKRAILKYIKDCWVSYCINEAVRRVVELDLSLSDDPVKECVLGRPYDTMGNPFYKPSVRDYLVPY